VTKQLPGGPRTDHIVVFEGNEQLVGQALSVRVAEGDRVHPVRHRPDGEQVGCRAASGRRTLAGRSAVPRISLTSGR